MLWTGDGFDGRGAEGGCVIVARWLLRYGALFAFLFLAGLGYATVHGRYGSLLDWPSRSLADVRALEDAAHRLQAEVATLEKGTRSTLTYSALRSTALVDARLAMVDRQLADDRALDRTSGGVAAQLLRGGAGEVVAVHRRRLEIRRLEIEADFLRGIRRPSSAAEAMRNWEPRAAAEVNRRRGACATLAHEADELSKDWFWRRYRLPDLHDRVNDLRRRSSAACDSANALQAKFQVIETARSRFEARIHNLPVAAGSYAGVTEDVARALRDRWLFSVCLWLRAHDARRHLRLAAIGVALAIIMPFLIRILFYFVLAPAAARRPPIRLLPDSAPTRPVEGHSAVSQEVAVPPGWELLVKQGYLHHAPVGGRASTRWLLDRRSPVASLLRGLFFLTRYRDLPDGARAGVSAGGDPFAELIQLDIAPGQAVTLLPRLLVAVAQPTGRPLRITRHWRLASPHAWLTGQLRFLVFHGPATLVLKGYRGIHAIAADHDVELPQGHVVGFSANLPYGVVRASTFQPYLLGRESLLRDVVGSGPGLVLTEEAPSLAGGRASGHASHRLEDALDILLKFVGLSSADRCGLRTIIPLSSEIVIDCVRNDAVPTLTPA